MESSILTLEPNDLIVYFDETGSETLADPNYPVFGLGGCAITGDKYMSEIEVPWKKLKKRHFGLRDQSFHASSVDQSNTAGIAALGQFFTERPFARFAVVFTSRTQIDPRGTDLYHAMSLLVRQQLYRLVKEFMFYRFVLVFESSTRGNSFVRAHFSNIWPVLDMPNGPQRAPVEYCFVPKSLCHPGLEVADFVVQAAGRQSFRTSLNRPNFGKDFQSVFAPVQGRFAEIELVNHVTVRPSQSGGA